MKKQVLLLIMMVLPMVASAYDARIDGIYYKFNSGEKTASVTYISPVFSLNNYAYSGDIIIPSEVTYDEDKYSVTSIDEHAFAGCSGLTTVIIPNSVTSFGDWAFVGCGKLTLINIPASVTTIGKYAFADCSNLTSVTIPNSVTSIEEGAFENCSGLTSVDIPNSVTSIGNNAFNGCENLVSFTIPNSLKSIGDSAFNGCSSLTSIGIPNSVTEIQGFAFANCIGICSVIVPQSVTNIAATAFYGCSGLTSIIVDDGNTTYDSRSHCNAIIETAKNTLILGCKNTVIPNSVTNIGEEAFRGCSGLTLIEIPDGVTSIGGDAFSECSSLTSIEIPNGVKYIDCFTFRECSSLAVVTIPNSVKSIVYAFEGCNQLKDFYCYSEIIPTTDDNEFYRVPMDNATLHVPASLIESYKSKMPWSKFGHIIALPQITYIVNGQTYKSSVIPVGEAVIAENEPEKEGYTFSGWSEMPSTMPNADVTVTGTFTPNKYKLVYKVDDKEYKTFEVECGTKITIEKTPEREGCTFSGWKNLPLTMPAHDVHVTGSFTINKYELTYMVNNEVYKTYEVEYGAIIPAEEDLTKDGYAFSGWSQIPETMPAKNVTIIATFIPNKYTLTYIVDGKTYKTYEVECGDILSLETEPAKDGYVFSGWSEIPATMPARNLSVMGTFIPNQYMLTYIVDGETYKTYEVDCGETISIEAEPSKDGFVFSGWSEIPETMPAKDVTITGTFNVNNYKLIYMVDGEEYKTIDVEYGTSITPEAEPIKEGYTFSGWDLIPETMPAHDVTTTGVFTFVDAIESVIADDEYQIYTIDGKPIETLQKGVNIIKYMNGKLKKVVVK